MSASLHYAAAVNHKNLVSAHHGRQPMRDHNDGFSGHELRECLLYEMLVFRIGEGGRLVEYDDRAIGQDRTGD